MSERILPPSDEADDEQGFETGDDVYSELNFDLLNEFEEEGHIYESIEDELGDWREIAAEDMDE